VQVYQERSEPAHTWRQGPTVRIAFVNSLQLLIGPFPVRLRFSTRFEYRITDNYLHRFPITPFQEETHRGRIPLRGISQQSGLERS
jgi:hypothetical protein